ncbi:MAG: hypothetical protein KAS72_03220 [Phycisphaerales bacterium]|nr:hypothetical protein [Phycisphaerales bacterium]
MHDWTIKGADGQLIRGSIDRPKGEPRCVVLFSHGFKGYKDYGFIPVLGRSLAKIGCIVHRFNFSHSGMGEGVETFEHPDLFQQDTWNKQVFDITQVARSLRAGALPETDADLPIVFLGHSRGGATCLLTAGRMFRDDDGPLPAGVITMSAPSETCSLATGDLRVLLADGRLKSPSARTGQDLYIGADWYGEQQHNPADHDLLSLCGHITCPVLAVHGRSDPTVPAGAADEIAVSCPDGVAALVEGGDHVYNTANPAPSRGSHSDQLQMAIDLVIDHIRTRL